MWRIRTGASIEGCSMNDDSVPGKPTTTYESGAGAPGTGLQSSSQDDCPRNETAFFCSNMEFDDFDAQSELLKGHRQEYVKLSTGPFRGRLVSAVLGRGVSVHYETVNCAMYQRVRCPEGQIEIGVSLGRAPSPSTASNYAVTTWSSRGPVRKWNWTSRWRGPSSWCLPLSYRFLNPWIAWTPAWNYSTRMDARRPWPAPHAWPVRSKPAARQCCRPALKSPPHGDRTMPGAL